MKVYIKKPLILFCFICSFLLFISCSKDSDLFNEYVLSEPETEPIENADGVDTDGGDEEGSNEANKGDVGVLLIDSNFDNQSKWELLNGSTVSNGILNLNAVGSVGGGGTSARWSNILNTHYYATRRFRLTFDARQVSGSGTLQIAQGGNIPFDQEITSNWVTYTIEYNGNNSDAVNRVSIGGRGAGDEFQIDNLVLEIIGDTTNPNVPGKPAQITFFTDFELETYGYKQWGSNGVPEDEINQWEIDNGEPRDTTHPEAHITSGRDGTGEAAWMGVYNNDPTRNEFVKDIALPFGEHWNAFSIYPQDSLADGRILMQYRNLAPGGSSTVNAISLRQYHNGKLGFAICSDVSKVDQTRANLGYWNGAGTNTEVIYVDYNFRGWNDVVIHYKGAFGANYTGPDTSHLIDTFGYDPRSDGYVEIWINGVKVVDHVGTTLYRYERRGGEIRWGMSPKIGTYWGGPISFASGGNAYYDNYAIWVGPNGTYEDVDPSR